MDKTLLSFRALDRAASWAAVAVVCLSLSPATLANATVRPNDLAANVRHKDGASEAPPKKGEVLTDEDVSLYRSIFTAQEQGFWKEADLMIAHLGDHRLLGYVLADRYQRRPSTLSELQTWLTAYHDQPKAADIYALARKLPGGAKAKLARPLEVSADVISGRSFGFGTGSGFRPKGSSSAKLSPSARRSVSEIEAALHRGEPHTAKALIETASQQQFLPKDILGPLQSRLAASYFYNGDMSEAQSQTATPLMQDDPHAIWINGLSLYKQSNHEAAATAFESLATRDDLADSDRSAAAFWAYRALKRTGETGKAAYFLALAAEKPHSFYGLLANTLRGRSPDAVWSWRAPDLNQQALKLLSSRSAGARALALVQIGQIDLAENELRHLNPKGNRVLQESILALAEKSHMAGLSLKLAGATVDNKGKPYDTALYPVPAWEPTGGFRVERALIYALMRHESQFDPTAVSNQGACGLMQLMPATADLMSGSSHDHARAGCPDQFFDPVTNLGLGQSYVQRLAEQPIIGNNLLLLLAAYNGGPGRLSQRSDLGDAADPLLFIESLPAKETHDYVQQVLLQYWTYRARLHQPLDSIGQLAHGEWPRYTLHDMQPTREASLEPSTSFRLASNTTVH